MSLHDAAIVTALTMILAEGFALAVFPEQIRQMLLEVDPRVLRAAGLIESCVAVVLLGLLLGR